MKKPDNGRIVHGTIGGDHMKKPEDSRIFMMTSSPGPKKGPMTGDVDGGGCDWAGLVGTPIPEKKEKSKDSRKGWNNVYARK